jgi:hypothetical protein
MEMAWTPLVGLNQEASDLAFLPTLGLDVAQTKGYASANTTLFPTIQIISAAATQVGIKNFDFWQLINWMFVVHYWGLLADFGQIAPTAWNFSDSNFQNYGPVPFSAGNNIFINESLFELYYDYFNSTVMPLYGYIFPPFAPLNETNKLDQSNVSLRALYACSDLTLRSSQSLVIAVIVADWAFITTFFTIALVIGTFLHTRREQNGMNPPPNWR